MANPNPNRNTNPNPIHIHIHGHLGLTGCRNIERLITNLHRPEIKEAAITEQCIAQLKV